MMVAYEALILTDTVFRVTTKKWRYRQCLMDYLCKLVGFRPRPYATTDVQLKGFSAPRIVHKSKWLAIQGTDYGLTYMEVLHIQAVYRHTKDYERTAAICKYACMESIKAAVSTIAFRFLKLDQMFNMENLCACLVLLGEKRPRINDPNPPFWFYAYFNRMIRDHMVAYSQLTEQALRTYGKFHRQPPPDVCWGQTDLVNDTIL